MKRPVFPAKVYFTSADLYSFVMKENDLRRQRQACRNDTRRSNPRWRYPFHTDHSDIADGGSPTNKTVAKSVLSTFTKKDSRTRLSCSRLLRLVIVILHFCVIGLYVVLLNCLLYFWLLYTQVHGSLKSLWLLASTAWRLGYVFLSLALMTFNSHLIQTDNGFLYLNLITNYQTILQRMGYGI